MAHKQLIYKNEDADLRLKYRKHLDISIVVSLFLMIIVFYAFQRFEAENKLVVVEEPPIEQIDAPPPTQSAVQPPPAGPSIPVEAESDEEIENETIEETDFTFEEPAFEQPPPKPEEAEAEIVPFFALSDKPQLKKSVLPKYPDLARRANLEGKVIVKVLIGTDGRVEKAEIVKSIPMLDDAALEAAKQYVFTPAKQRDKTVKVWMTLPIIFKLR
ncbi:MAG: hypothetical protein Kow00108_24410 [Calditrichia bacterium]